MEQEPKIEKDTVLQALREKGLDDPAVLEMVQQWTREQELKAEQDSSGRGKLLFDLDRQDLYLAAGMKDDALQNLLDLLGQADAEGYDDLRARIAAKIEEIKTLR